MSARERGTAPPDGKTKRQEMNGKRLRDAVHGDIELNAQEVRILDTPQMQRLRGIRQLGAAFLVYPGAQHSRFEHCVGTCWMTKAIIAAVEADGSSTFDPAEKDALCVAALVHDVTHIPFGHTFEDERRLLHKHDRNEKRYEYFFDSGALAEILESTEAGRQAKALLCPTEPCPARKDYLRQIVSGTVCADLLDYLRRDNYFCGLRHEFDDRVFRYFRVAHGQLALDLMQSSLFRRDALSEITNLLRIRYVLSERVYYHHAKIAAGVMISKAIEAAMAAGLTEEELCELTDYSLVYHLRVNYGQDEGLRALLADFASRRLFRRAYMLTSRIGQEAIRELVGKYHLNRDGARTGAEARIAAALGAAPHQVAIYCAPERMALKEAEVPVLLGTGSPVRLADLNSDEIQVLKRQHRALWKLYVFVSRELADATERAGEICEELFDLQNELPHEVGGKLI